ncbi:cytosolic sulfotransferase 5-like [Rutidosis leptorrhynchoides]|uniref:cytosolic sulfotransferase 5-like n=1 Tax=Rutidosis leptorrhynchoides TaxID=125765 RepID=UPI003A98D203
MNLQQPCSILTTTNEEIPPLRKLTEEEKDQELLRSLPSKSGWISTRYYNYQGFWQDPIFLQAILNFQKHFEAQPSDILLVTGPKSGTVWLKALVFFLVNRSLYPEPKKNHPFMTSNPHDLVPFLEVWLYIDNKVPDFSTFDSPRILSSHLPFVSMPPSVKDSACKIVYLCRNPKDTLVSMWHFTTKLRSADEGVLPFEEAFDKFCKGVTVNGPYWDHELEYWKESLEKPLKVLFLKYEELKKQPHENLKKLAEFLGCPFSLEEEENGDVENILKFCSFENLSNMEINVSGKLSIGIENKIYFRPGLVGDYVNHLSPEMIQRLDQITQEKFNVHGLQVVSKLHILFLNVQNENLKETRKESQ